MMQPTFKNLSRLGDDCISMFCSGTLGWLGQNPRLYKFRWWVFHSGSPAEGAEFLGRYEYSLSTRDAMEFIDCLTREKKIHLIYNRRYRRAGPDVPWKKNYESGEKIDYAPVFDEDSDPIFEGHK